MRQESLQRLRAKYTCMVRTYIKWSG